jgi:hypothetical protein
MAAKHLWRSAGFCRTSGGITSTPTKDNLMRNMLRTTIAVVLALAFVAVATADVPTNMNVQGQLKDGAGDPVAPGLKFFTFKIFSQQLGGPEIWPAGPGETQTLATDANGLWNAAIGTLIPLTEAVFLDTTRWLELTVDNGVDPAETLPRIKLNTNPFTYRAASAQQADAISGNTLGDLTDQFVNITGDTMSGFLTVDVPNKNGIGSSILANNVNDGITPLNLAFQSIAIVGEASSDGAETKFSVLGWSRGADGGKVGTFGQADGAGEFNIGLYGFIGIPSATENFAGYFYGGDVTVLSPATVGDSSVRLPNNAISSAEILAEPGLAASPTGGFTTLTTTRDTLQAVTITCPDSGFVVIICEIEFRNNTANTYVNTRLYRTGGTLLNQWDWDPGDVDGFYDQTQTKHVVDVVNAGPITYYLDMNMSSGTANTVEPKMIALFFPTAYGSVSQGAPPLGGDAPELGANAIQDVPAPRELDVEAMRQQSIEANLARMERELAEMRTMVENAKLIPTPTSARSSLEADQ